MIEEAVLTIVAHLFGINRSMISKKVSHNTVVRARIAYVLIMTTQTKLSLKEIGHKIDVSHDMVIHYKKRGKSLFDEDIDFEFKYLMAMDHLKKYLEMKRKKIIDGNTPKSGRNYLTTLINRS